MYYIRYEKDDKTCKKNNKIRIAAVTTSCHKKYARRRPYLFMVPKK